MSNTEFESRISPWEATLWGRWALAGLLGGAIGGAAAVALAGATYTTPWFTVFGFVLVATLVAGVAQAVVLGWQVAWAGRWLAASIAGWLLGAAVGAGVGAIMSPFLPTPGLVGVWAIGGAGVGAVVGMAAMQTLVLRREAARPAWWFVASVLAWAVAGALVFGQFLIVPAAVGQVVAGAAAGAVAGAISGIALIWLLRRPAAEPTGHPQRVRLVLRFRSVSALVKSLDVRFGLEWLLVSALGALGGAIVGVLVGGVVGTLVAMAVGGGSTFFLVLGLAILGAAIGAGIGVGVAQWRVLRHEGIRRAGWWAGHCNGSSCGGRSRGPPGGWWRARSATPWVGRWPLLRPAVQCRAYGWRSRRWFW